MEIGKRLKEERLRLGKSQQALATALGIAKKSQTNYELGHSVPPVTYLAAAAAAGVDVLYVLTGVATAPTSDEERDLLRRYRGASPEIRKAVFGVLGASTPGIKPAGAPRVLIKGGSHGQVVAGDAKQTTTTISVGRQKKGKAK